MIYSYTQISQYLACPRRYRHRYLDGWQKKGTRAAMLFGRAFERALAAYFLRQDPAVALFQEWKSYEDQNLKYSHGDSWDRMLEQGIQLLNRFCQDDRVRIRQPRRNLQIKFVQKLSSQNEFVAYIDAIGKLDGQACLLEWKTTSSRYPEAPEGLALGGMATGAGPVSAGDPAGRGFSPSNSFPLTRFFEIVSHWKNNELLAPILPFLSEKYCTL